MSHALVKQFHSVFRVPAPNGPTGLSYERRTLRMQLLFEEFDELCGAQLATVKESIDGMPFLNVIEDEQYVDQIETLDALGDIVYLCYGMAIEMGVNLDEVIAEIHRSNMSKADENGNPILREDGKILKGPHYFKPDIAQFWQ